MITKLPYGLKNNKLVSIHAVEKGLGCNCICPACKGTLVARKGKINVHHFSHYKEENCEHAIETALHLAAKEIIEEKKEFMLPPFDYYNQANYCIKGLSEKKEIKIDKVELEIWFDNFRPDLLVEFSGKKLIIEIAVTHFVDEEKLKKITYLFLKI